MVGPNDQLHEDTACHAAQPSQKSESENKKSERERRIESDQTKLKVNMNKMKNKNIATGETSQAITSLTILTFITR